MKGPAWTCVAMVLAGCQSVASNPEYGKLPEIAAAPNETAQDSTTAKHVRELGNSYRQLGEDFSDEDRAAGASVLGAGFYGAATTAFRPLDVRLPLLEGAMPTRAADAYARMGDGLTTMG